ncbi:sterile alpha motif domain-containing protein 5 [Plakobranchus ocellatus]|uniref:Sterile alpha motif domain-containing protein 5 n=1 Tax=Plakobranchus ocellatus TaxID=259542 RepID=A0AAV4ABN2_9GAST|nr:sterile alpha motif domain-containing protein 5 [Plakobranchus ocellatus]
MTTGSNSIVEDWLRSVGLVQYTQAFLDNGYDDLEVCKQIGEDDLAAIGVSAGDHREQLLGAVKVLKEEGGAAVYFTLEECCDTCQSEDEEEEEGEADRVGQGIGDRAGNERRSGGIGSNRPADPADARRPSAGPTSASVGKPADARSPRPSKASSAVGGRKFSGGAATAPSTPSGRGGGGGGGGGATSSLMRMDAYELGKSALVTFPGVQLKLILRDKLVENNIDLSGPPYTNSVSTPFMHIALSTVLLDASSFMGLSKVNDLVCAFQMVLNLGTCMDAQLFQLYCDRFFLFLS